MKLGNIYIGKDGRNIAPLVKDATVVGLVEVDSAADASKKLEEIKKAVTKPTTSSYLIIAFKAWGDRMRLIQNNHVAFRCPNTLKEKLEAYATENDIHVSVFIRSACIAKLKKDAPHLFLQIPRRPEDSVVGSGWLIAERSW